jgi:hypothetical protein
LEDDLMACRHTKKTTSIEQTSDGAISHTTCDACDALVAYSQTDTSTGQITTRSHVRNEFTGRMYLVALDTWG